MDKTIPNHENKLSEAFLFKMGESSHLYLFSALCNKNLCKVQSSTSESNCEF